MTRVGSILMPDRDRQITFRGVRLGAGTPYRIQSFDGWQDMAEYVSGNRQRSASHGSWPGTPYLGDRIITVGGKAEPRRGTDETLPGLVAALRRISVLAEDDSEWPFVNQEWGVTEVAWCSVTGRVLPSDRHYYQGLATFTLQFTATDPLIYSTNVKQVTLGAGGGSGGLVFPLDFPLDFGTPAAPLSAVATNDGEYPTGCVITIDGPGNAPKLYNRTNRKRIGYDVVLATGEQLVIDTDAGTALLGGADRAYLRSSDSGPTNDFKLESGDNDLVFFVSGADPATTQAVVTWRNARG